MLEEVTARGVTVKIRAPPHRVVTEVLSVLLVAELLQGIRPQQVAHRTECGRLLEAVQLKRKDTVRKQYTNESQNKKHEIGH